MKKKRFRPKKLFKKVFSKNSAVGAPSDDPSKSEQQTIKLSPTLDSALSATPSDPSDSPTIAASRSTSLSPVKEIKKSLTVKDTVSGNVAAAAAASPPAKSPGRKKNPSSPKKGAKKSFRQQPLRNSFSTKVSDWEDFGTTPTTTTKALPATKVEEIPFDEQTQQPPQSFFTKSNSKGNVEVAVNGIYNDLEEDQVDDMELTKYNSKADAIPFTVSVTTTTTTTPAEQQKQPDDRDDVPAPADGLTKERSFASYETESGLRWQILSDGTLEMGPGGDAPPPPPPPPPPLVKTRGTPPRKPPVTPSPTPPVSFTFKENKKEPATVETKTTPVVPSVTTQKARSLSPLQTATIRMASNVRRVTSLSVATRKKSKSMEHLTPQPMNDLIVQHEQIHRSVRKEDPAPFTPTNSSIRAVPEVDDEENSVEERPVTAFDTAEGTEILSTFGIELVPYEEGDSDDDIDNDTTFDLAEFEEGNALLDCSDDEKEFEVEVDNDNVEFDVEVDDDLNDEFDDDDDDDEEFDDDQENFRPVVVTTIQAGTNKATREITRQPLSPPRARHSRLPRPALGRSRESIEAEQQHGSLHQTPDPKTVGWLSPDESEDADDELTEFYPPSHGVGAGMSFFDDDDDDDDEDEDDEVVALTKKKRSNRTSFGDMTDDGESDDEEEEEGDTLTSIGADLTEMATELRTKGPGVLMEWMDLRPLK